MLNRRNLLAAALAGPALAATAIAGASAATAPGRVSIDVSRLVAQGVGPNAARIRSVMERELAGPLGPSLQRQGAALVVTVNGLSMTSYAGGGSGLSSGSGNDGLDSTATLVGTDGRVIASWPVVSSSPPSAAGPWYAQDIDAARIDSLARTNAGWIRRYVGG